MQISMLINGENVPAEGGGNFDRHDPVADQGATTAPAASVNDALRAVEAASAAFPAWSKTGPTERRMLLLRAADALEEMTPEIIQTAMIETGATSGWIGFNCMLSAQMLREAASITTQISGEIIPSNKPVTLAMAQRKPLGVCLAIVPWNASLILGTRAVATAVACGNTVILKASDLCPTTHLAIGEAFRRAGFPSGVVNVVTNAPLVVLDDADLEGAVNGAAFGAFMKQGQICMSTERIIAHDAIADRFIQALTDKVRSLPAGDPRGDVVIGSLATPEAAEKMDRIIADAVEKGATIISGGTRNGSIVEAILIDGVTEDMTIYSEESFGPVKPIIRAKDDEDAVRIANNTDYGLSAAICSSNIQRTLSVADRIQSGICHINGPTVSDEAQMPFGGIKDSGYGRIGRQAGIDSFTTTRWVTIEDPKQHFPF